MDIPQWIIKLQWVNASHYLPVVLSLKMQDIMFSNITWRSNVKANKLRMLTISDGFFNFRTDNLRHHKLAL